MATRITQSVVEVLRGGAPKVGVTQVASEILRNVVAVDLKVAITQVCVEVLRQTHKPQPSTANGWAMYKNLHAVKDPSTGRIAFSGYYPVTAGDQPGTRPISFLESIDHGVNWYPVRSLFFDMTTGTEAVIDNSGIEVVATFTEDQNVFGILKYYDSKLYAKTYNFTEGWRIRQYTTAGVEELVFDPEISAGRSTNYSMAVDDDYIYVGGDRSTVGDLNYPHFRKFNRTTGALIATYATGSVGVSENPMALYADNAGNVYIAAFNNGLRKFTDAGVEVWTNACFMLSGAGEGEFANAMSITSDGTYIYVLDYNNGKILKYNCSDGAFVAEASNEVPVESYSIEYDNGLLYVTKPYGISIFNATTLALVSSPVFPNNEYDPRSAWNSLTFDGTYFWTLGGDGLTVVQFSITS